MYNFLVIDHFCIMTKSPYIPPLIMIQIQHKLASLNFFLKISQTIFGKFLTHFLDVSYKSKEGILLHLK